MVAISVQTVDLASVINGEEISGRKGRPNIWPENYLPQSSVKFVINDLKHLAVT